MLRGFVDHHLTRKYPTEGYAWDKLPEGSLVVDVGGGVGAQSLTLATHFPQLRFVVQDREPVVRDAIEVRDYSPNMVCI
jgi:ubiquinone/menaquinone biosynthesis C-methylase UbiE